MTTSRSSAAETWQRGVYRKVNQKMKLLNEEFEEEIGYLRSIVEELRNLRKQLLTEEHD